MRELLLSERFLAYAAALAQAQIAPEKCAKAFSLDAGRRNAVLVRMGQCVQQSGLQCRIPFPKGTIGAGLVEPLQEATVDYDPVDLK
jgi:hypothetical protein